MLARSLALRSPTWRPRDNRAIVAAKIRVGERTILTTEAQSSHGSTVREASRQASSTAFGSEPVEESPRAEFFIAAHHELSRRTRPPCLRGEYSKISSNWSELGVPFD